MKSVSTRPAHLWQLMLLLTLLIMGLALFFLELLEWRQILEWARGYTEYAWLIPVLILVQVVLFMFALPGSTMLWVATVLYPPVTATLVLVAGATLGGLAAYWFSRHLAAPWKQRIQQNRIFHTLEKRGDFLTLCALRVMPGFPHSVINYSSGILHLPLGQFLMAAVFGLSFKTYLYANVIHQAVEVADPSELIQLETLGPMVLVSALFLLARVLQHYWGKNHG